MFRVYWVANRKRKSSGATTKAGLQGAIANDVCCSREGDTDRALQHSNGLLCLFFVLTAKQPTWHCTRCDYPIQFALGGATVLLSLPVLEEGFLRQLLYNTRLVFSSI